MSDSPADLILYGSFAAVFALSVAIVWFAATRTQTTADYLVAGTGIGPTQNALALAGDFVGVGGFFAITGLIALHGLDGFVFGIGAICGFPLMLFLFAEPLRRLGRYTLADVLTATVGSERPRVLVALTQLIAVIAQLTAQLVGALALLHLLFGIAPVTSLSLLGGIILAYVMLGGMLATTWLQMVKCCLMIAVALFIAIKALALFGYDPMAIASGAFARAGPDMLGPGTLFRGPWDLLSILLGLALGNASMPHILMRMNTVRTPADARRSVFRATGIIVLFHLVILLLGLATAALVARGAIIAADPGGNMALPLLARRVGGDGLLGIVSAVALATVLAVVAGLVMAGAAALSHDLLPRLRLHPTTGAGQLLSARLASVVVVAVALALAFVFRGQNLGFLSALGYAVAASANFPTLILGLFWPRFTPAGAVASMAAGLSSSLLLIWLSPIVQVNLLHGQALFPLQNPALVSVPFAFVVGIAVSLAQAKSSDRRVSQ